ncbi:hypothetical protein PMIN03_006469 [Paraphaeosphaeria minitans]
MASKVAESLARVAAGPIVPADDVYEKAGLAISASGTLSENAERDSEQYPDGLLHQVIERNGKEILVSWNEEEEAKVVRKADFLFLPLFTLMFTWMAIDRTNVSGVLTSTFLKDTGMTRDQANTGVSLLWFGIVLLEIPSNMVLHRVGAHYWIPLQVIAWGFIEVLQMFVKNSGGWYAARLFLGMAESGFIPGCLYTLSRWYTQDELAKRTTLFFFGPSLSAAFGSLISAGSLRLEGHGGLKGWQWIFIICGVSTITTGVLALAFIPKSPHDTDRLFGGIFPTRPWLSSREADIFVARIIRKDPKKGQAATMKIRISDIIEVLSDGKTWPYLLACLSGLQSVNGLSTWGATIIKSLGFTSIRANLLSAPPPIIASLGGLALSVYVDRCKRFGYAIMFTAVWTMAGLIALFHLPVTEKGSWSFYAALVITNAAPSWQPLNVTWLSLNSKSPQHRAIAYAVYIGCSNLGGTYGNQVFRGSDAPLYRNAWIACLSLGAVWLAVVILQVLGFKIANGKHAKRKAEGHEDEQESLYIDEKGRRHLYYW